MSFNFIGDLVFSLDGDEDIFAGLCRLFSLHNRDVGRSVTPLRAFFAAWHYMHMEVRRFLSGDDAVVLDEIQTVRIINLE